MISFRILFLTTLVLFATVPAISREARWKSLPDGTRVPVPPREHPRLYLRADRLDDLKARVDHPVLRQTWQNLQALAGENAHCAMTVDALRYLLDGDPRTGRRAIETALEFLPQAKFREYGDVSRDYGRVLWSAAVVYDWCHSLLSSDEKDALIAQCVRLAEKFECGYPIRTRGTLTGHVAEWMIMRDMLSAGVAIYDESPEIYDQAAGVFFRDFLPARNWFYPGGAQHQGVAYGDTRFGSDLYPLFIFDRMGFGNVYHPSQRFVPYHWIYMRRPDGRMMTQGDDFVWTPKLPEILTSAYYHDGYILADYLKDEWDFSILKHATHPMDQLFVLLWRDPDLEPWDLNELPTTRYFGFPFGWMVARTGWDEDAVIASMQVNVYNFLNHQHQDAGAFQIWYKGVLAADTGLYSGTGGGYVGAHNVNYYKRTIAHNSLLVYDPSEEFTTRGFQEIEKVNDGGQRLPNGWVSARELDDFLAKDYKTGDVLGWWLGPDPQRPEVSYLKGDITQAYSRKVSQVRRSFVFLDFDNTDVPAALVVFDRVVSTNPSFRKYWLLHSVEEPLVDGAVTNITLTQNQWSGRLVNTTLLPAADNFQIEKVGGPTQKHWVFGQSFESYPRPRGRRQDDTVYEDADWRIQLSPVADSAEDLFLNAMLVTDRENDRLATVVGIDQEDRVGALIADRAVLFSRNTEASDGSVTFTLPGSKGYRILVADLAEGIWQVRRNGEVYLAGLPVPAGAGVLFFEGPAGNYELLR